MFIWFYGLTHPHLWIIYLLFPLQFINTNPSISLRGGDKLAVDVLQGEVSFNNVNFAYPTRKEQVRNIQECENLEKKNYISYCIELI